MEIYCEVAYVLRLLVSVCPSVCMSVHLFVSLSVSPSVFKSVCPPLCICISPSFLNVCLSCISVRPPARPLVSPSIHLSGVLLALNLTL